MKIIGAIGAFIGSGFGLAKLKKYLGIGLKVWSNRDLINNAAKAWGEIDDVPGAVKKVRAEIKTALRDKELSKEEIDKILVVTLALVEELDEAYDATNPVIMQLKAIMA
jgi:hypothetical protein